MTQWRDEQRQHGDIDRMLARHGLRMTRRGDWALVALLLVCFIALLALVGMVEA